MAAVAGTLTAGAWRWGFWAFSGAWAGSSLRSSVCAGTRRKQDLQPNTARLLRMLISACVAGAMGVGSNLLTAINAQGDISKGALTVAVITGVLLALKDVQAYLAQGPISPKDS